MKKICKLMTVMFLIGLLVGCQGTKEKEATDIVDEQKDAATAQEENKVEEVETPIVPVEEKEVVPRFGGTLNIASYAPTTLNPIENDRQSVQEVLGLIYDALFELDSDLKAKPNLVESYTFENEGSTLKLQLKSDIFFHNGTLLTTADVDESINLIKEAAFSSYKNNVSAIRRVTVEDEYNMTIYYDKGYAYALSDLTFPIVSKDYMISEAYDPLVPVGTGAYEYVDYQKMQHLDLKAYENWSGGDVYIENIHCTIVEDEASYETLFDQNLIDVMNPSKFNWLKYSENEHQTIDSYTSSYYDFIGFNFDNEMLQNNDFRKAFAYAINRDYIVYDRMVNHGILTNSVILPNSWFAPTTEIVYNYDTSKAESLLPDLLSDKDEDGFLDIEDGLTGTGFRSFKLTMIVHNDNPLRVEIADYIVANLEQIGLKVVVEVVDSETYYKRIDSGDFDLVFGGWKLSQKPDYAALFSSNGSQNFINYKSERMDQALQSIVDGYTDEQVMASVESFESVMIDEVPYISLYFLEGAVMKQDNVYGDFEGNTESMFNGIENIYLDF